MNQYQVAYVNIHGTVSTTFIEAATELEAWTHLVHTCADHCRQGNVKDWDTVVPLYVFKFPDVTA